MRGFMKRGEVSDRPATEATGASDIPTDRAAIARRAYELYVERGAEPARALLDDWFRAEAELLKPRP
jgi:hypothetical protein